MPAMKKFIYLFIILLAVVGCNSTNQEVPKLDITWKLDKDLINDQGQSRWILTLTNPTRVDFPADGWSLYFNNIQTLQTDSQSFVSVARVNGDLRVIKPLKGFNGIKAGQSVTIPVYSSGSIITFTDAPIGFYLVFNSDPSKANSCKLTREQIPVTGLKRSNRDNLAVNTPDVVYHENTELSLLDMDSICPVLPTPKYIKKSDGQFVVTGKINIGFKESFNNEAQQLKLRLKDLFSGEILFNQPGDKHIILQKSEIKGSKPGSYNLLISKSGIIIQASEASGIFYGVQSLMALVPFENWKMASDTVKWNCITINDEPRFEYRGMHLDVARNFQPKENVMRLLDAMAFYKLNKFHFHICDDEGWRLQINGLPELTDFGAFRGYSENESKCLYPSFGSGPVPSPEVSHGCGYYTTQDFIDILKYATERHIEVIPEIDMPGHARVAIRSMQKRYEKYMAQNQPDKAKEYLLNDPEDKSEYRSVQGWNDNVVDAGLESTYHFIEKVTDEIIKLFNEADAPLTCIHTGGDEVPHGVWQKSPACIKLIKENDDLNNSNDLAHYFTSRFSEILSNKGLIAAGWEEIALNHGKNAEPNSEFTGRNLRPYVWNNTWNSGAEDIGYKLANAGFPVVLAHVTNLYFDLAYNKNPNEPGYYWGSFVDTRKPWEYTPMDISNCAFTDHYGNSIDSKALSNKMVKLTKVGQQNILGIQGLLWSENDLGLERLEYLAFPKLLGLAERAWAQQPDWAKSAISDANNQLRESDWNQFVNTVGQIELPRLDYFDGGLGYRIPVPGAIIKNNILYANTRFPGLKIKFTTDGSEPNENSELYKESVKVNGVVKMKSFSEKGRAGRTITLE